MGIFLVRPKAAFCGPHVTAPFIKKRGKFHMNRAYKVIYNKKDDWSKSSPKSAVDLPVLSVRDGAASYAVSFCRALSGQVSSPPHFRLMQQRRKNKSLPIVPPLRRTRPILRPTKQPLKAISLGSAPLQEQSKRSRPQFPVRRNRQT